MIAPPAPRLSVVERLRSDGRFVEALAFLLKRRIAPDHTTAIRCLRPRHHRNGDEHPSMIVEPKAGRVDCKVCGISLGLLALGVEVGIASSESAVAERLEQHFYGDPAWKTTSTAGATVSTAAGHVSTGPSKEWPYFHDTITQRLGWTLSSDRGRPAIRVPTWHADGSPGKTKVRWQYPSGSGGARARFVSDHPSLGLLNLLAAREYVQDSTADVPVVVFVSSETDIAAWTSAAAREGLDIPAFGSATGEASAVPGQVAELFRGCRVLVFQDNDETGRREAPKRVAEFIAAGCSAEVRATPEGTKDLCDHVRAGGSVREFLAPQPAASEAPGASSAPAPQADPTPSFAIRTLADLHRAELKSPEWLVPSLVGRKRLTLVVGSPKAGKSLAVQGLGSVLASGMGGTWLGTDFRGCPAGYTVLYVCAEGGLALVRDRSLTLTRVLPETALDRFHVLGQRPFPLPTRPD